MCMTSVNHLLLVLNCIMNFVVYCCFNAGFKRVVLKLAGRAVEAASDNAQMELEDQGNEGFTQDFLIKEASVTFWPRNQVSSIGSAALKVSFFGKAQVTLSLRTQTQVFAKDIRYKNRWSKSKFFQ